MAQVFINTMALAAAYALLAIGFVLVLNATGAVNLAHGSFVVVGGFIAASLGSTLGWPGYLLLPLVVAAMMLCGAILSIAAYYPLRDKAVVSVFIATLSVGTIYETTTLLVFGPSPRVGPPIISAGSIAFSGVTVSIQAISMVVLTAVLIAGQWLIMSRTLLGKRLRAVAQDREIASALGMNVQKMIIITFAIAGALAGAAGLMFANLFFMTPGDGESYVIKTYVAATLGGWGSLRGAFVGALIVAIFETIIPSLPLALPWLGDLPPRISGLFSATTSTICLYLAFLVVLFYRPQGLFGEAVQRRA